MDFSMFAPFLIGSGVVGSFAGVGMYMGSNQPEEVNWLMAYWDLPRDSERMTTDLLTHKDSKYYKNYECRITNKFFLQVDKTCEIYAITPDDWNVKPMYYEHFKNATYHAVKEDFSNKKFYKLKVNNTALSYLKINSHTRVDIVSRANPQKKWVTLKSVARGIEGGYDAFVPYLLTKATSAVTSSTSSSSSSKKDKKEYTCKFENDTNFSECFIWSIAKPTTESDLKGNINFATVKEHRESSITKDNWYVLRLKQYWSISSLQEGAMKKITAYEVEANGGKKEIGTFEYKAGMGGTLTEQDRFLKYLTV